MKFLDFSNLRGDLFGGVTAGVVALPLALAFGEASGAGPIAGLWGAIFVGFCAAIFGGTGAQVSGPTGPMVVVFAGVFASLSGKPELVFPAVLLAGLLQILFGVIRLGQYITLVPYPVVSGFMSGIGCIIIALQTSRLFGHEPDGGGTIPALTAIPGAVLDPNWQALIIASVTLGMVFLWPKPWARFLPGSLAALIVGTLLGLALGNAPKLGDIPTGFPLPIIPQFSLDTLPIVLEAAVILAVLGSIDSLLTSLVADNMTRTRHRSNQELVGQGIGNALAGLFGAIPGAGATMRTVVNIRTGGRTSISGATHALVLLAVVVSLAPLAAQIPHAVLAGILVKVGFDIIDFAYLKRAHRGPRLDLLLMALVLGLTVFADLITAVIAGVVLAALAFIKTLADDQLQAFAAAEPQSPSPEEADILKNAEGAIVTFEFTGPLSFGAAADLAHVVRIRSDRAARVIVLDFTRKPFMDVSAAQAVETIACDAAETGRHVFFVGVNDKIAKVMAALNADRCVPEANRFADRLEALRAAQARLRGTGAGGSAAIA